MTGWARALGRQKYHFIGADGAARCGRTPPSPLIADDVTAWHSAFRCANCEDLQKACGPREEKQTSRKPRRENVKA